MIHGVFEVQDQNLYGYESNIDNLYEGGNMRSTVYPRVGLLRFGAKTCMVPNLILIGITKREMGDR